jgi:hypothetical protein
MIGELVRYDAMCRAIDAAFDVDEVKDIRDKAMAFEVYAATKHCPSYRLPECPGVYVFNGVERVLYVGESRCIRRRILQGHHRGYLLRVPAVETRIIPCLNHKQVERWLIAELNPSLNGISPTTHRRHRTSFSLAVRPPPKLKRPNQSFDEMVDEMEVFAKACRLSFGKSRGGERAA